MTVSNVCIAVIWVYSLFACFMQGLAMPHREPVLPEFEKLTPSSLLLILLLPFAICLPLAFFQRGGHPFDVHAIRKLVDGKWGAGTYDGFFARLRPVALFMLSFLVLGITGMASTVATTQSVGAYFDSGVILSFGLGLLAAYLLSIRFPPRLE